MDERACAAGRSATCAAGTNGSAASAAAAERSNGAVANGISAAVTQPGAAAGALQNGTAVAEVSVVGGARSGAEANAPADACPAVPPSTLASDAKLNGQGF